jgi:hypothetical protein
MHKAFANTKQHTKQNRSNDQIPALPEAISQSQPAAPGLQVTKQHHKQHAQQYRSKLRTPRSYPTGFFLNPPALKKCPILLYPGFTLW